MKSRLKSTHAARELIKRFEAFHAEAAQQPDGGWIVGYGHRAAAKPGVTVTSDEADLLLIYDLLQAEDDIEDVAGDKLTEAQRDALVSFVHGIGSEAFRNSDVARYLFEGRAMAAGEALAIYGETQMERREAESALFMTAFAPPSSRRADEREQSTVEVVIKVEHPAEAYAPQEPVEALAEEGGEPVAPAEAPPVITPPPPDAREVAARREAEDEIARILAAVGASGAARALREEAQAAPAEQPVEAVEAVEGVETDEPVKTDDAEAVEAEAAPAVDEADPQTIEVDTAPVGELVSDAAEADTADATEAEPAIDNAAETEAQGEEASEAVAEAENADEADMPAAPEAAVSIPLDLVQQDMPAIDERDESPLEAAEPEGVAEPELAQAELSDDSAEPDDAPALADPFAGADLDTLAFGLARGAEPVEVEAVLEPRGFGALPANTGSDHAQTDAGDGTDAVREALVARMSREIAGVKTDQFEDVHGRASVSRPDDSLPANATVGYVFMGGLSTDINGDFDAAPAELPDPEVEAQLAELAEAMREDPVDAAVEPDNQVSDTAEAAAPSLDVPESDDQAAEDAISDDAVSEDVGDIDDDAAEIAAGADIADIAVEATSAPETDETERDETAALVAAVTDVVEREIAVAGEETAPPLTSDAPFEGDPALMGEVTAHESSTGANAHLQDSFDVATVEPLVDHADEMSPEDLSSDTDVFVNETAPDTRKKESGIGFQLSLLAGGVVAVVGGLGVVGNWDQIWASGELNRDMIMLIGGVFLVVASAWQLISIWLENRKDKAPVA